MNVRIRVARSQEWERARDLRLRALADAPDAFGSTLELERTYAEAEWRAWIEGWTGATNRFVFCEADGGWVGMAVGSRATGEWDAHLYGMWVDPASRRQGVGERLVSDIVGWARSWEARSVILGLTEGNAGAERFYEHLGFVDTGERHPLREGSELVTRVLRLGL
ncbi:MAG: GNAT family N-acetyltransferase [Actinobacteria bacterium]|nr:GNAT family N-acetyltransferase [Actinomycetota bacterium]